MIRSSSNPVLSDKMMGAARGDTTNGVMTIEGTVNRSLIAVSLTMAAAYWSYSDPAFFSSWLMAFVIGGLVIALAISFKPTWAPTLTPVYAVVEGFVLGTVSLFAATMISADPALVAAGEIPPDASIVFQAVSLTFGTLFSLLMLYKARVIKVTERFRMMVFGATMAIMLVYLISFGLSFFGMSVPYLHSTGPIGIGISLVIVGVAALNLVLDFDFIERTANTGQAPKYMEWYGAFGLLVTLVWLYLEILNLLMKLYASRD